ncbi:MAG TPA: septal ring lytic transglycosylase RlpA family protein [Casimicrobiaceae bacterium]
MRNALVGIVILLLAACSASSRRETATTAPPSAASAPSTRYYLDDGPPDNAPANLDAVPDAVPRVEALSRSANRPYTVMGREYVPATALKAYRERGIASWYGRKFHGQKTSIGETYDMFAMTAAHPTLPLPSYARVTNLESGKSVVVRVNDRGPFLHDRIIDLSYAAAYRLGVAQRGSGRVEVEAILPGSQPSLLAAAAPLPPVAMAPVVATPAEVDPVPVPAPAFTQSTYGAPNGGYAVQLGAFASHPNALNFLAHVQNQLTSAQVEAKVRQSGGLYRVYVGPYADRDEARRVGERITQAFGFATTVAPH